MAEQLIPKYQIPQSIKEDIDRWIQKYPPDRKASAVLAALSLVQKANNGWLEESHIQAVAEYLEMPRIAVDEVATFYTMFNLSPVGKYSLEICTSLSCMLCGCDKIVNYLEKKLGVKMGETTSDGIFTLRSAECLAACVNAPMMRVGEEYYEDLTIEKVDSILLKLQKGAEE